MNTVTVRYSDNRNKQWGLSLNGWCLEVTKYPTGKLLKGGREQQWFTARVSYPWNESNKFLVQAATLAGLVKKLENMEPVQAPRRMKAQ